MTDKEIMKIVMKEAKKGDFPWGAAVVKNKEIIAKAHNTMIKNTDATAHAEINAIRKACKKLKSVKLTGCTLYVSASPCPMCFSAAWRAGIKRIVYGDNLPDRMNIKIETLNKMSGNKIKMLSLSN